MQKKDSIILLSDETIANKIYIIRGQKVMLDFDLAELYQVETKRLKEQVKRNIERFPEKYMFVLTKEEAGKISRSQNATLKQGANIKYLPYAFTEHGVLQLSNILKSTQAIKVSFTIIDVFVKLRDVLTKNTEILLEIEHIKKKLTNHDKNIELVFQYLDELLKKKQNPTKRTQIGYKLPIKK